MTIRAGALLLVPLLFVDCKKTPEPTASPSLVPDAGALPAPVAPPQATPDAGVPPVAVTWVDPPGWKRSEKTSMMRKATYAIPHAASDKEDGELGVFYFGPGQGGGIEPNVERWVKQFKGTKLTDVKRADRVANDLKQHTVEIESGTFDAGQMGGPGAKPKSNYALLGAIVEAPSGSYFFKLVGPKATVVAAKKSFYALLDSVKPG